MQEGETTRRRGGFKRPIRLGPFIRDTISSGLEFYALQVWGFYRSAVQDKREEQAKAKKKKLPKTCPISYAGFRAYLYALRQLGLIEYTGRKRKAVTKGEEGEPVEYLAEVLYFKANLDRLGDPAWLDPMSSYPRKEE